MSSHSLEMALSASRATADPIPPPELSNSSNLESDSPDDCTEGDEVQPNNEEEQKVLGQFVDSVPHPRPDIPAFFQCRLLPHQVKSLQLMTKAPRRSCINAAQMGLGKTRTAIAFLCNEYASEMGKPTKIAPMLVVAPKSVIATWQKEFEKCLSPTSPMKCIFLKKKPTDTDIAFINAGRYQVVVVNYERVTKEFTSLLKRAGCDAFRDGIGGGNTVFTTINRLETWKRNAPAATTKTFHFHLRAEGMDGGAYDTRPGPERSWLYSQTWHTVVWDEGQLLRDPSTLRYLSCFMIHAIQRHILTGTPVYKDANDIYNYLRMLRKADLRKCTDWYSTFGPSPEQKEEYLCDMTQGSMFWIQKKDVPGLKLPPKKNYNLFVPLATKEERDFYMLWHNAAGEIVKNLSGEKKEKKKKRTPEEMMNDPPSAATTVLPAILRCRQACDAALAISEEVVKSNIAANDLPPGYSNRNGWAGTHASKMNALVAFLKEHAEEDEKIVIFTNFKEVMLLITERLALEGYGSVVFHGELSAGEREKALETFRDDRKTRFFVSTYGAGAVGINLDWATREIQFDMWWIAQILRQAEDRVHRITSKKRVVITRFIAAGTIEQVIAQRYIAMEATAAIFYECTSIKDALKHARQGDFKRVDEAKPKKGKSKYEELLKDALSLWKTKGTEFIDEERNEKERLARAVAPRDPVAAPVKREAETMEIDDFAALSTEKGHTGVANRLTKLKQAGAAKRRAPEHGYSGLSVLAPGGGGLVKAAPQDSPQKRARTSEDPPALALPSVPKVVPSPKAPASAESTEMEWSASYIKLPRPARGVYGLYELEQYRVRLATEPVRLECAWLVEYSTSPKTFCERWASQMAPFSQERRQLVQSINECGGILPSVASALTAIEAQLGKEHPVCVQARIAAVADAKAALNDVRSSGTCATDPSFATLGPGLQRMCEMSLARLASSIISCELAGKVENHPGTLCDAFLGILASENGLIHDAIQLPAPPKPFEMCRGVTIEHPPYPAAELLSFHQCGTWRFPFPYLACLRLAGYCYASALAAVHCGGDTGARFVMSRGNVVGAFMMRLRLLEGMYILQVSKTIVVDPNFTNVIEASRMHGLMDVIGLLKDNHIELSGVLCPTTFNPKECTNFDIELPALRFADNKIVPVGNDPLVHRLYGDGVKHGLFVGAWASLLFCDWRLYKVNRVHGVCSPEKAEGGRLYKVNKAHNVCPPVKMES
jgi:hypothetical protein